MKLTYPGVYANNQASRRPQWPFGINRLSPQAKGLTAWWPVLSDRAPGGGGAELRIHDLIADSVLKSSSTLSTAPTLLNDSRFDRVLSFDGTDDIVTSFLPRSGTGATAAYYITAATGVMSAWIKPIAPFNTDANVHNLESPICVSNAFFGIHIGTKTGDSGDRIYFLNNDGTADFVSAALVSGEWILATWRHAGGRLYGYVNGIEIGNIASGNTANLTGTMRLGRSGGGAFCQCLIMDVRIYNFDIGPQAIYQIWHPATRWDLYKPMNQQYVYAPPVRRNEVFDFQLSRTAAITHELERTSELDFTLEVD